MSREKYFIGADVARSQTFTQRQARWVITSLISRKSLEANAPTMLLGISARGLDMTAYRMVIDLHRTAYTNDAVLPETTLKHDDYIQIPGIATRQHAYRRMPLPQNPYTLERAHRIMRVLGSREQLDEYVGPLMRHIGARALDLAVFDTAITILHEPMPGDAPLPPINGLLAEENIQQLITPRGTVAVAPQ